MWHTSKHRAVGSEAIRGCHVGDPYNTRADLDERHLRGY